MLTQEDGSRWSRGIRSAGIVFHTQPRNLQSSTGIHEVNRIMLVRRLFGISQSTRPQLATKSWRRVNKSVSGKHIIIISCKGTIENFSPSSHIPFKPRGAWVFITHQRKGEKKQTGSRPRQVRDGDTGRGQQSTISIRGTCFVQPG